MSSFTVVVSWAGGRAGQWHSSAVRVVCVRASAGSTGWRMSAGCARPAGARLSRPISRTLGSDSLALMDGVVDIYMPDLKLASSEVSRRYVGKREYFEVA